MESGAGEAASPSPLPQPVKKTAAEANIVSAMRLVKLMLVSAFMIGNPFKDKIDDQDYK